MSKELEALENIKHYDSRVGLHEDDYQIIETALKEYAGFQIVFKLSNRNEGKKVYVECKAFKIIKEKNVNVGDFKRCKSLEDYNDYCCYSEKEQVTQEEYDLLKEALK